MGWQVGQKASRSATFSKDHVMKYAEISGDYNRAGRRSLVLYVHAEPGFAEQMTRLLCSPRSETIG